ncbi:MAG: RHS repeat-associated core domain-containing protein [Proteobacteria bacterium]|nr:RHS repeat-associated core domain-containing protein [Pseudomonadota bacterium]
MWSANYSAWGKRLGTADVTQEHKAHGQTGCNLRFQGQYWDEETGLHYNTFRYYDPEIGRFISPDPIGVEGGFNLYAYVPNPTGWVDTWGWTGTYIFTDGTTSYIGKGPIQRAYNSMGERVGGKTNVTKWVHMDFADDKLGFMVEHKMMEKYNARQSPDFANSPNRSSPGKKLYEDADVKTKKSVDKLANKIDKKFKNAKSGSC